MGTAGAVSGLGWRGLLHLTRFGYFWAREGMEGKREVREGGG